MRKEFSLLLDRLSAASEERRQEGFADVALQSALLNLPYLKNPHFESLLHKYRDLGALGLNLAHTGTVVGVLFEEGSIGKKKCKKAQAEVQKIVGEDCRVLVTEIEGQRNW